MGFGDRLRQERDRLGLAQGKTAEIGEVSVQSQRMYESDKRVPTATYLSALANEGFDVQFLVTGHFSSNAKKIYDSPTDALNAVVDLQEQFGKFNAEQLKVLLSFAYQYQAPKDQLADFIVAAKTLVNSE